MVSSASRIRLNSFDVRAAFVNVQSRIASSEIATRNDHLFQLENADDDIAALKVLPHFVHYGFNLNVPHQLLTDDIPSLMHH